MISTWSSPRKNISFYERAIGSVTESESENESENESYVGIAVFRLCGLKKRKGGVSLAEGKS